LDERRGEKFLILLDDEVLRPSETGAEEIFLTLKIGVNHLTGNFESTGFANFFHGNTKN
jgi:hypothetical protein